MKKVLNLYLLLLLCFGCTIQEKDVNINNETVLIEFAEKNGFKIQQEKNIITEKTYVKNINQLKSLLENTKNTINKRKTIALKDLKPTDEYFVKKLVQELQKKSKNFRNEELGNPPYKYTYTVYFDNSFPCSNVYITINYNLNSNGQISDAEISSGSYGYSFGNTYSQNNLVSTIQNGILVFEITGFLSSSIGIGDYNLANSNGVKYTGYIQSGSGGGALKGRFYQDGWDFVKQQAQF